jgi:hypothetical protein
MINASVKIVRAGEIDRTIITRTLFVFLGQ